MKKTLLSLLVISSVVSAGSSSTEYELVDAVQRCDRAEVVYILKNYPNEIDVNNLCYTEYGWLLGEMVAWDDVEIVKLVLSLDADLYAKPEGTPYLHCARSIEMLRLLINEGIDVNVQDKNGQTALSCFKSIEIADFLLSCGADVNIQDEDGRTALFYCWLEKLQWFIGAGIDVNIQDNEGRTALMYYVENDRWTPAHAHIQALIEAGANPKIQDKRRKTVLMYIKSSTAIDALIFSKFSIIESLPSILELRDSFGTTALMHHVCFCYSDFEDQAVIVAWLIVLGANVNAKDNEGRSILDHAKIRSNGTVVDMLIAAGAQ